MDVGRITTHLAPWDDAPRAMLLGVVVHRLETSQHGKVHQGQAITTDGPFTEAREVLGGYFVLEAKDFDEAMKVASACPTAREGTVFVHPIMGSPTRRG